MTTKTAATKHGVVAYYVKRARSFAKMSQAELGGVVGCTKQNVSGWENERHTPSPLQLADIARKTGLPLPPELAPIVHGPESIHTRIKRLRLAKNMSMDALAIACGVGSWQAVQQWECGKSAPKLSRAPMVASALGVSVSELLDNSYGSEASDKHSEIGLQIKKALDRAGHTQDWLAEACDVSSNAVSKWIKTGKVSKRNIPKLCKHTGLNPAVFLGTPPEHTACVTFDSPLNVAMSLRRTVAAIAREWGVNPSDLTDSSDEALARVQRAVELVMDTTRQ